MLDRHLQIAQEWLQRPQTRRPILPPPKVPDEAHPPYIPGPGRLLLHHGIIQPSGKQHQVLRRSLFSLKCYFYLMLHPVSLHRLLTLDEQQLVLPLNGVVDLRGQLATRFEVVRRKPAGHSSLVQIGIQLFSKRLIVGGGA